MATRQQLHSAFKGIADALRDNADPSAPDEVREPWLAATLRHTPIARRAEWLEIATDCDVYGTLADQLERIADALADTTEPAKIIATLELADMAIGLVDQVLDTDPCGARPD